MTPEDPLPPDLAALLQDLPAEVEPEDDLWDGIAAEITPVPLAGPRRSWGPALLVAAAVLIGAVGVVTWPTDAPTRAEPDHVVAASLAWEDDIRRTTDELQAVLDAHRDRMDPEAVAAIEQGLEDIDAAIEDVQRALIADPGNNALEAALAQVWQTKVNLLRHATEGAG
jgi:hypothetical protein